VSGKKTNFNILSVVQELQVVIAPSTTPETSVDGPGVEATPRFPTGRVLSKRKLTGNDYLETPHKLISCPIRRVRGLVVSQESRIAGHQAAGSEVRDQIRWLGIRPPRSPLKAILINRFGSNQ
jgi:hypothetical protein